MKRLLITGFEPYKNETINASWEIANLIKIPANIVDVTKVLLPAEFDKGKKILLSNLNYYKPDFAILLGQSGGKTSIRFERVAINIASTTIEDNIGYCPDEELINPTGPAAYFTNLPIVQMKNSIRDIGIPADISNSAGTHLCNYVFYLTLDWASKIDINTKVGFIHFPFFHEQIIDTPTKPSMNKIDIAKGIETSILSLI